MAVLLAAAFATPVAAQDIPDGTKGACLVALKSVLHDPGSADFTDTDTWYARVQKNKNIHVQPRLRAKNAYGAYVLSTWNCIVKVEPDGFRIISLKQVRP